MALISLTDYSIKITYPEISANPSLVNLLPLTIIAKAKDIGYVYYDDFTEDLKYNIAVQLFKNVGIIRLNSSGVNSLDNSQLPFTATADMTPIEEIDKTTMINYFFKYNVEVKNILITVYKDEYQISIPTASLFMDTLPDNIELFQTDINQFIITIYRRYISTPYNSIAFMPWYGTRIKEYLHDLSVHQVEEMLQSEMDGITKLLKNYFILNDITDLNFTVSVSSEENIEYGVVKYKIIITINDTNYTITVH